MCQEKWQSIFVGFSGCECWINNDGSYWFCLYVCKYLYVMWKIAFKECIRLCFAIAFVDQALTGMAIIQQFVADNGDCKYDN